MSEPIELELEGFEPQKSFLNAKIKQSVRIMVLSVIFGILIRDTATSTRYLVSRSRLTQFSNKKISLLY